MESLETQGAGPRRPRMDGLRRSMVGASVRDELRAALEREAAEQGKSLSTHIGDVLAEHAGVPA